VAGSFHVKSTTYRRHVTDFTEILLTTQDVKPRMKLGLRKVSDLEDGLFISNGS